MRPHPRIRRTVKWGGVVASVMMAVAWGGGALPFALCCYGHTRTLAVGAGQVVYFWGPAAPAGAPLGFAVVDVFPIPFHWWFEWHWLARAGEVVVPLWAPLALALIPTTLAWRIDLIARHRQRAGLCLHCAYNLAGLPAGVPCPECGKAHGAQA